jgi:nitroreductase/NAD-dependent dihydropyrimidine dehydrogenase PreA subunit
MITVDRKRCRGCGLCAHICHEQCIVLAGQENGAAARIDHALCSTCTQCIAICPQRALSWDHAEPVAYDGSRLPTPEELAELLMQRRTIRYFQPRAIDQALLEEIVGVGIYAPTNNYALRAVVVDDPGLMETLDAVIMRFIRWIYNLFYRSDVVFRLVSALTPAVDKKGKVKMARALARGRASETLPAATVFVVGDRRILLSEASAQYALYNMILYAQARGIGSRINAGGPITLDRSHVVRTRLGLRRREHILATLELGYPAVRFRNKVEGRAMPVAWNGQRIDG